MNLAQSIEAVLFYAGEPMEITRLASVLEVTKEVLKEALRELSSTLENRGIVLIETEDTLALMTHPQCNDLIEKIRKEERKRDIGKAGAETLAIIAYNGTVTRGEIDFIRGVNSTFILRNLLIRGLIERTANPHDARTFVYRVTPDLFAHLGVARKEELPQFAEMHAAIATYKKEHTGEEQQES